MKRPFTRLSKGSLRRAAALLATAVVANCGGADAPNDPSSPGPSPSASASPSPQAGGAIAGAYTLEIRPAPACPLSGATTFPVTAVAAATPKQAGVQVVLAGAGDDLQLELLSEPTTVAGGVGTTERGTLSNEARRVWLHAIGSGAVTRAADGRGQVLSGRLSGYVAHGQATGAEGSLGSCDAVDHFFALRVR